MLLTLNKMSSLLYVSHLHQHSQEVFAWVCFVRKVEPVVHVSMYKLLLRDFSILVHVNGTKHYNCPQLKLH